MRFMIKGSRAVSMPIFLGIVFIEFLKRLINPAPNAAIFLIVDRGPAHIAKEGNKRHLFGEP